MELVEKEATTVVKSAAPPATSVAPVTRTATAAASSLPKVYEQQYKLKVNEKKGIYHPLPAKIREDTGKIGSEFKSVNGRATGAILKGLTIDQERYFAPQLITKNTRDADFTNAMLMYWADFTIDVPKQGLILNANYTKKNVIVDGETVEIEYPENLLDYITATFAKQSSKVAFTVEEKSNVDLYVFVMEDLSIEKKTKQDNFKIKTEATKKYIDLVSSISTSDHTKIDWLLDVLKDPNELFYNADFSTKCMRLEELVTSKTTEFLAALEDKNLEFKSLLHRFEQSRIVIVEGEARFFSDQLLGASKAEAIVFLQDQTNSIWLSKMKAQLQEILKIKVV